MDRGDVSIENVAKQFLVEGSEIENRDGLYTDDDYIPTPKNIPADFLHSFEQNEHNTGKAEQVIRSKHYSRSHKVRPIRI